MEAPTRRKIDWDIAGPWLAATIFVLAFVIGATLGLHAYYIHNFTGPCAGRGGQNSYLSSSYNTGDPNYVVCNNGTRVHR